MWLHCRPYAKRYLVGMQAEPVCLVDWCSFWQAAYPGLVAHQIKQISAKRSFIYQIKQISGRRFYALQIKQISARSAPAFIGERLGLVAYIEFTLSIRQPPVFVDKKALSFYLLGHPCSNRQADIFVGNKAMPLSLQATGVLIEISR